MVRKSTRATSNTLESHKSVYALLLKSTVELLLSAGYSKDELRKLVRKHIRKSTEQIHLGKSTVLTASQAASVSSVLHVWHSKQKYLQRNGKPRPLSAGRGQSDLAKLIAECCPGDQRVSVMKLMTRLKLVRRTRTGRYKPTNNEADVVSSRAHVLEFLAGAAVRLIQTGMTNITTADQSKRLILKHVYVPDLPRKELRSFRDLSNQQGKNLANVINVWLEQRRSKTNTSGTHDAGLFLFSHIGRKPNRV